MFIKINILKVRILGHCFKSKFGNSLLNTRQNSKYFFLSFRLAELVVYILLGVEEISDCS